MLDLECVRQPFFSPTLKSHLAWEALEGSRWACGAAHIPHRSSKRPHPTQGPYCVSRNRLPTVLRWLPPLKRSERLSRRRPQPERGREGCRQDRWQERRDPRSRAARAPYAHVPALRGRRRTWRRSQASQPPAPGSEVPSPRPSCHAVHARRCVKARRPVLCRRGPAMEHIRTPKVGGTRAGGGGSRRWDAERAGDPASLREAGRVSNRSEARGGSV